MSNMMKQLKITLMRSTIAIHPIHKKCVKGLGLRRPHHTVIVADTPCHRGLINKISYLVSVEEI